MPLDLIYWSVPLDRIDLIAGRTIMPEKENRNFALRDKDANEIGVFTGKSPRQAAFKAAIRGHTDIKLRERETKKSIYSLVGGCRWTNPRGHRMDPRQNMEATVLIWWIHPSLALPGLDSVFLKLDVQSHEKCCRCS